MKSNISKTRIAISFLFVATLLLANGCASPATSKGMQARLQAIKNKHPSSVAVEARGGEETSPLWCSEISSESFCKAISDSILECGVFRAVVPAANADYLLEPGIINVQKPAVGFDMAVNMTVNWRLTRLKPRQIVFQNVISKSYTATVGDAFAGIKRLRLAEEGAARENIEEGLLRISNLQLEGKE